MRLISSLLDLLLPNYCVLCRLPSHSDLAICADCATELPKLPHHCQRCGRTLPDIDQAICGQCLTKPPPFHRLIAAFSYESPVDYLIGQLKFNGKLTNAKILGHLLMEHIANHYQDRPLPQLIIPVPLHKKRYLQREFNQAVEIAKPISRQLNLPLISGNIIRHKNTQPQSELPEKKRQQNIKNSFKIIKSVRANHIAIIDDVVTTGSTVNELSRTLIKDGIKRIDIWCCAKT